jgi:hypothetical protein
MMRKITLWRSVKPNVIGNLERGIGMKLCESINLIEY